MELARLRWLQQPWAAPGAEGWAGKEASESRAVPLKEQQELGEPPFGCQLWWCRNHPVATLVPKASGAQPALCIPAELRHPPGRAPATPN